LATCHWPKYANGHGQLNVGLADDLFRPTDADIIITMVGSGDDGPLQRRGGQAEHSKPSHVV
jgi:hypothetical protein